MDRCRIVSNAICAGTDYDSSFNHHWAFAVNVASSVAETTRLRSMQDAKTVPTITGSAREFYIKPMLSCIGDYDIMHYFSHEFAIPAGYSEHVHSSSADSESFNVYEIQDSGSGISNYVYLFNGSDSSVHVINEHTICVTKKQKFRSNCVHSQLLQVSGPAIVRQTAEILNNHGHFFQPTISSDFVYCLRCPVWPPQASEWPQRLRYSGWPNLALINRVVSQGCDVVPVSHPCHKDDTSQWRLSFSRAEVVLINSWTMPQQIVYHMLRFFVKTERLTGNTKDGSHVDRLSMYHIKTLTLWACELQQSEWWENHTVIELCRILLNRLGVYLHNAYCYHYFVENCNLLLYTSTTDRHIEDTAGYLRGITDPELADWFVQKYLKKYADYNCPSDVQLLFYDIKTSAQLETALSAVIDWRTERFRARSLGGLESAASDLSTFMSSDITPRMCKIYEAERDTIGPLHGVFVAFVFLKCAGEMKTRTSCLRDRTLHVLTTVAGSEFSAVGDLFEKRGTIAAETLGNLMASWNRCISAESDISPEIYTELTKAFLHLALRRYDHHVDGSVRCLANGYLAVLYYISRHFQTAIDFCRATVTKTNNHCIDAKDQKILKVDAHLMSKYDNDISTMCGLVSLYHYVKRKSMLDNQRTRYCTSFCSAEALVRYVAVKCHQMDKLPAATHVKLYEAMQQYRRYFGKSPNRLFLPDILLFQLAVARCPEFHSRPVFRWNDYLGRPGRLKAAAVGYDADELSEMLIQSAVERLTEFRKFELRQFGSDCVCVTTDYEALNAYRRQQYDTCLKLSQDIVNDVLLMECVPPMCVDSPQLVLMDDNIASIVGIMHLIGGRRTTINRIATQLTIALYLEIQCLIKLNHPVSSLIDALLRTQIAYHRHDVSEMSLNHWILAFIYRKARLHLLTLTKEARNMSPASLRDGESMVHARVLPTNNGLVLQVQTITKTVSYAIQPVRLLM